MDKAIALLSEYVSHASVSNNPDAGKGMEGARTFVRKRLETLGFEVETVETPLHPILLGRRGHDRPGSENWPHVMLYAHYDVQPPEPLELWESPPFEATVRGERIYGRGAADNKGPFIVHTCALEILLERIPDLPLRLTYLVEGEEEIGSPSFAGFLEQYQPELNKAGVILISDTGSLSPEQLVVTTSLRGLTDLEVTVHGARSDLHSGLYGGALLNPIQALFEMCASLHNPDGTINVPGFYDGVVEAGAWEREEVSRLGMRDAELADFLGVAELAPPPGYSGFEAIRFQPTLEFNGISGGYQGPGPKTVIPSTASCKITCRLVPHQDPRRVQDAVVRALEARSPGGVRVEVSRGACGNPYLVVPPGKPNAPEKPPELLVSGFRAYERAIAHHFGKAPLYLREGGSIPIVERLQSLAGLDSILLGLYTPDDAMHAPNESFHLGIMEKAIPAFVDILEELAGHSANND